MKARRIVVAALLSLVCGMAGVVGQATADVGISQQAVMVGDKPVSGRYSFAFNNYKEQIVECHDTPTLPEGTVCVRKGYRVARGTMSTKLVAYRIKERIDRYSYYVVDVDINVVNHSGSSDEGWARVKVRNPGALVDRQDSNSVSADGNGCDSIDLTMSTPWPIVSAAVDLGHVTLCDAQATFKRTTSGKTAVYSATRLAGIKALTVNRAVKVAKRKHPVFKVTITVPRDVCTAAKNGLCTKYDNKEVSKTYKVGTTG